MTAVLGVKWGSPQEDGGCPLDHVVPGGPADMAGAEAGDIVATIDDELAIDRRRGWANGTRPKQIGVPMAWEVLRHSEDGAPEPLMLMVAFAQKEDPPETPARPGPTPRPLGGGTAEVPTPFFVPPSDAAVSLRPSPISIANGSVPSPSASPRAFSTGDASLDQAERQRWNLDYVNWRKLGATHAEAAQRALQPMSNDAKVREAIRLVGIRADTFTADYDPYWRRPEPICGSCLPLATGERW
jgi:hypothetical protein